MPKVTQKSSCRSKSRVHVSLSSQCILTTSNHFQKKRSQSKTKLVQKKMYFVAESFQVFLHGFLNILFIYSYRLFPDKAHGRHQSVLTWVPFKPHKHGDNKSKYPATWIIDGIAISWLEEHCKVLYAICRFK